MEGNSLPYQHVNNNELFYCQPPFREETEAYKRMTDSITLREPAPKFDKVIGSVCNSFYNPALASKASTRVQI
jgi:hypothetical protein